MHLVNYTLHAAQRAGLLLQDWLVDLESAIGYLTDRSSNLDLYTQSVLGEVDWFWYKEGSLLALAERVWSEISYSMTTAQSELIDLGILISLAEVDLLPSVCHPGKIIGVGLNYLEPGEVAISSLGAYPVLFLKPASALTGHGQPIFLPRSSSQVMCEGELAVVIGKTGKHIPPQEALSFVAGYTIANDVSARDFEQRTSQWTSGKISDSFCPLGPALVTADEISDPNNMNIRTTLNGKIVQEGNTAQMRFKIADLISYISGLATLEPGDLILTGSPKGIGASPTPAIPMQPGDIVAIEIEGLGVLTNPVMGEE